MPPLSIIGDFEILEKCLSDLFMRRVDLVADSLFFKGAEEASAGFPASQVYRSPTSSHVCSLGGEKRVILSSGSLPHAQRAGLGLYLPHRWRRRTASCSGAAYY